MNPNATPEEILQATEKDVLEMNEGLIEFHNSVVKPDDMVYHLGDFSLSKRGPEQILPRLNGKEHHLITGNHDWCHPTHSKNPEKRKKMLELYLNAGFKSINLEGHMDIGGHQCLLSHFPYLEEDLQFDKRYPDYRPKDEGLTLLHGHIHGVWHTKKTSKGTLMIDIGVDSNGYKPVSIDQILDLIKNESQ
jgi:calcineurin-like phosphoesterase family protein